MYVCGLTLAPHLLPTPRTKNSPQISHRMRNALGAMLFHEFLDYALKKLKIDLHLGFVSYQLKIYQRMRINMFHFPSKRTHLAFMKMLIIQCWLNQVLPQQCGLSKCLTENSTANGVKLRVMKAWCILLSKQQNDKLASNINRSLLSLDFQVVVLNMCTLMFMMGFSHELKNHNT